MLFYLAVAALEVLPVLQLCSSWGAGTVTKKQMIQRGIDGWPFIAHGPTYGDFIILSPITAWMIIKFCAQWTPLSVMAVVIGGVVVSGIMHWVYCRDDMNTPHILNHRIVTAGWIHFSYTAVVVAVLFLYCFATPMVSMGDKSVVFWSFASFAVIFNFAQPFWYMGRKLFNIGTLCELILYIIAFTLFAIFKGW